MKILYLDDTHVTDEGEEVEEGWLDAVVQVAAASRLAARGAAALEGLVWLVEAKEESVVHIILRHATSASQSAGYRRGQVTIIQPGVIHVKIEIDSIFCSVRNSRSLHVCLSGTSLSGGLHFCLSHSVCFSSLSALPHQTDGA